MMTVKALLSNQHLQHPHDMLMMWQLLGKDFVARGGSVGPARQMQLLQVQGEVAQASLERLQHWVWQQLCGVPRPV